MQGIGARRSAGTAAIPTTTSSPSTGSTASRVARRCRRSEWRPWLVLFGLLFVMSSAWALTMPLFGSPDEPAHGIRAAAVARGQFGGRDVADANGAPTFVRVPAVFARSLDIWDCYTWKIDRTPACAPAFAGPHRLIEVPTVAGHYPPLYYLIVGGPARFWPSAFGVYLMRILSAAACCALLASALLSVRRMPRGRVVAAGAILAVTPMVLFLSASINPNGLENAAGLAVWASGAALVIIPGADTAALRRFCVAAFILVNTRPLSPVWCALIVAILVVLAGWRRVRELVRMRRVQAGAAAVLFGCLLAAGWLLTAGRPAGASEPLQVGADVVRGSIGKGDTLVQQMVGRFGWLDIPGPALLYVVWLFALGAVVIAAIAVAPRRGVVALAATVVATVLLPVVIEVWQYPGFGLAWQGRYTLPLAVGVPVVAGVVLGSWDSPIAFRRRFPGLVFGVFVVGHVLAYGWVARHYAVGSRGGIDYLVGARWQPPVPFVVQLLAFGAATVALAAVALGRAGGLSGALGQPAPSLEPEERQVRELAAAGHP